MKQYRKDISSCKGWEATVLLQSGIGVRYLRAVLFVITLQAGFNFSFCG